MAHRHDSCHRSRRVPQPDTDRYPGDTNPDSGWDADTGTDSNAGLITHSHRDGCGHTFSNANLHT